jgi:peptide-N4-(N-acetyl-beta-glucosaminyl)asparagine amidase
MSTVVSIRNKRQSVVSDARKKFLTLRTLAELSELMITREPTKDELRGRSSGSLAWRLERGETNVSSKHVFKMKAAEASARQFNLRYSCAKNRYERFIAATIIESADDWKTWEYQSESIFRKVENDHKMAYLSRTEDAENGSIEWKFDFGASVKSIDLKFDTKTFESGHIRVNFLDSRGRIVGSKDDLIGSNGFSIIVNLSGGNGDCAWQHAQLFRENLNSKDYPFQLSVQFN